MSWHIRLCRIGPCCSVMYLNCNALFMLYQAQLAVYHSFSAGTPPCPPYESVIAEWRMVTHAPLEHRSRMPILHASPIVAGTERKMRLEPLLLCADGHSVAHAAFLHTAGVGWLVVRVVGAVHLKKP